MIEAVFFDAAGILYKRSSPTETFALELLTRHGFSTEISTEDKDKLLEIRSKANQGTIDHSIYWEQFLLFRGVKDPQQRNDFYQQIVEFSNNVQPVPDGREALAKLKEKHLRLGIITDTMYPVEWKMRRLEIAGVAEFIDIVACSTDLGAHKPDPVVYKYAIQQANLAPNETAFVGHLGVELLGARQAGMTTIAIDQDPDANADYFCKSLSDISDLPIF